ncbi:MAG: hypothetical protein HZB51_30485 [Chloroflexi bacterium]|nr:hypothetical protein [Chloroflexota bacterium]
MGVTIHYNGKLDDPRALDELLITAKRFCREHNWKFHEIDDRIIGKVERWIPSDDEEIHTQTSRIDDRQRGLLINPHPESETVWLTFNQHGELCFYMPESDPGHYWESKCLFTKTQFAPLEVHMAICDLLHLIKDKHFPSLEVYDEGEYFETGDPKQLAHKIGFLNNVMDQLEQKLSEEDSDDPAVNAIRDAVDEVETFHGTPLPEGKPPKDKKRKLNVERGKKITLRDPEWKRDHGISAGKN